ncbi:uncharacterized protein LOC129953735 isoform X1 [Eupeodes corollae]|uniref:uncharacterized protein LOC129953735 isoform X1 n=2 Tax=Eupeodes corollae TaxID=290404 RepID=UPI00248FF684|nr:uncharacterized protein LOC129953735 isoform X1 [Eupeodes corollae]
MISRTTKFYIIIMRMKKNLPHQLLHLFPNQLPIPGKFHKSRRKTRDHFPKKKQKNWEQPDQTPNPLVTCSAKADKMVWNFELLIETIKKYPSLWNIKDKNYWNRVERNSDWTKVLVEIDSSNQVQQKLQSEAISLLKEINKPREEKTYATLTCELVRQDMESLPDSEQRALRKELFELVDRFVARNCERGAD